MSHLALIPHVEKSFNLLESKITKIERLPTYNRDQQHLDLKAKTISSGEIACSSCAPTYKNSYSPTAIVAAGAVTGESTRVGTAGVDGETGKEPDNHLGEGGI
ncbi:hypothetical protein Tco_0670212 [Tanacetum coccineum]